MRLVVLPVSYTHCFFRRTHVAHAGFSALHLCNCVRTSPWPHFSLSAVAKVPRRDARRGLGGRVGPVRGVRIGMTPVHKHDLFEKHSQFDVDGKPDRRLRCVGGQ